MVDYPKGIFLDNAAMDISEIRLNNLRLVLAGHFGGVKAELARAMGVAPNNISRYFNANPRDRRNVADRTARAIEKAICKPKGWMDTPHPANEELIIKINQKMESMPPEKLKKLSEFVDLIGGQ